MSNPVHLVMRFSDQLFRVGNVIERHTDVLDERGVVWVAKLGRPIGHTRVHRMNAQIAAGVETYCFLVQATRRGPDAYRCSMTALSRSCPTDYSEHAPPYYDELGYRSSASTWVQVRSIEAIDPYRLQELSVASSGQPLREALRSSMSSTFFVR